MLPGTSVTYYGEEIGMEDSCVYYDDDHNNPGHRCNSTYRPENTDARYRTPMQWTNGINGGFTTSNKPWLPIGDKYQTVNVEAQKGVNGSHLEVYKSLQKVRQHKAIKEGSLSGFKIVKLGTNSFGFKRELNDVKEESLFVLLNYGKESENVNLKNFELIGEPKFATFKVVGGNSKFKVDEQLDIGENFTLSGFESVVAVYNNAGLISCKFMIVFIGIFAFLLRIFL